MTAQRSPSLLLCILTLLAACADDGALDATTDAFGDVGPDGADGIDQDAPAAPPRREPPVLVWAACELVGAPHDDTTCAATLAPLSLRDPQQRSIELFVKRVLARPEVVPAGAPRRAVWILMGGPGQAGADGEDLAALLRLRDPGLDVYLPDHRGTGLSYRLGCPVEEGSRSESGAGIALSEWAACRDRVVRDWGDQLAYFSTTEAALDLESLIRATHADTDQVVLLGISYGTYLANRYLQLFPDGAGVDGVALDSICASDRCILSSIDVWEDDVARQILDHCSDDPDCARVFPEAGPSAWDELGRLLSRVAEGHCPLSGDPELDVELLRLHMGQLMFSYAGRRLTPALIHRYHRCSEGDVAAIRHSFVTNLGFDPGTLADAPDFGHLPVLPAASDPSAFSMALAVNITRSELWATPAPTLATIVADHAATRSCRGAARNIATGAEGWPTYDEPLAGTWPDYRIPILAMSADLDTATPAAYARAIEPLLTGPNQAYFEIPGHGHAVILQGQLLDDPTTTCGRELLLQFLDDPTREVDGACLAESLPLRFSMRPQAIDLWFGTDDLWE